VTVEIGSITGQPGGGTGVAGLLNTPNHVPVTVWVWFVQFCEVSVARDVPPGATAEGTNTKLSI
jgi:hypothetical protein